MKPSWRIEATAPAAPTVGKEHTKAELHAPTQHLALFNTHQTRL